MSAEVSPTEKDAHAVSAFAAETGLSLEKIQELKLKRRIKKRSTLSDISTTITGDDEMITEKTTSSKSHTEVNGAQKANSAVTIGETTKISNVVGAHVPHVEGLPKVCVIDILSDYISEFFSYSHIRIFTPFLYYNTGTLFCCKDITHYT
jgi:hypothetical protein